MTLEVLRDMVLGLKLVNHGILIALLDNVKNLCRYFKPIAHLPQQKYYSYCRKAQEKEGRKWQLLANFTLTFPKQTL